MRNKLISLFGLVSKAKYRALLASNDDWTQLCRDLSKENKLLSNSLDQTQRENANLKNEINALNNLRASDYQTINKKI